MCVCVCVRVCVCAPARLSVRREVSAGKTRDVRPSTPSSPRLAFACRSRVTSERPDALVA